MSKVSIVLPSYNGERFIRESIESVIAQDYDNWELIIIDDCSSDSTPEICEEYVRRDSRISYHRNEQNLKLPASLNRGFSFATGDYLTWTSDDNYFRHDAIGLMARALDDDAAVDVIYCDINCVDENGNALNLPKITTSKHFLPIINVVRACFMYRKCVHEKLEGYDETLFLVEDYDFWLRSYRYFNLRYIDEAPYYYRFHERSLSKTKELDIRRLTKKILRRELEHESRLPRRFSLMCGILVSDLRTLLIKIKR